MDSTLTPDIWNQVNNEIRHQYLDAGKARARLGWQSLFSLDESLHTTARWYQDFWKEKYV